jgi:cobalamin biosynthesis Co2+ chelatase CbiK
LCSCDHVELGGCIRCDIAIEAKVVRATPDKTPCVDKGITCEYIVDKVHENDGALLHLLFDPYIKLTGWDIHSYSNLVQHQRHMIIMGYIHDQWFFHFHDFHFDFRHLYISRRVLGKRYKHV